MPFTELLTRLSPKLKGIAYRLGHQYPCFGPDDLFQEELLHLWRDFSSGKLNAKTDSYILQGCYFYLKNYLRKAKIKRNVLSLEAVMSNEGMSPVEPEFFADSKAKKYLIDLNDKLLVETIQNNGLTDREKNILFLCAEGLTTREIGQKIGVSHVRIIKLMARIRAKCSKYLDNY